MILIRTDANKIIASGHVMRCVSIATYFRSKGIESVFILSDDNAKEILEKSGFSYIILDTKWDDIDNEIGELKAIVEKIGPDFLLVDTYSVTAHYIKEMSKLCKIGYIGSKKIVLPELDLLINYDINIDYNFYNSSYDSNKTLLLLGAQYAPLRPEFEFSKSDCNGKISKVLITTGNTNQGMIVERILSKIIAETALKNIYFHVIVGSLFNEKDSLIQNFANNKNIVFHQNVSNMSEIMKQCDIAISACGTTVFELIALKIPVISFSMVSEQNRTAKELDNLGIIRYCGESFSEGSFCEEEIVKALMYFKSNPYSLIELSEKGTRYIDGKGNERIYNAVTKLF